MVTIQRLLLNWQNSSIFLFSHTAFCRGKGSEGFERLKNNLLKIAVFLLFCMYTVPAQACTTCNKALQKGIFDAGFGWYMLAIFLPFIVMGTIVTLLYRLK